MAIKLDYVVRETATNLTRNVTLTLATILTVVVSLTLFGSALHAQPGREQRQRSLSRAASSSSSSCNPSRRQEQQRLDRAATSRPTPTFATITYVDQDETYEEFKRIFEGATRAHRDGLARGAAAVVPRGARRPRTPRSSKALGEQFEDEARRLRGGVRHRGGEGHPGDVQQDRRARSCWPPASCWSRRASSSSTRSAWRCSPAGARSR